jgi:hypothetical protein
VIPVTRSMAPATGVRILICQVPINQLSTACRQACSGSAEIEMHRALEAAQLEQRNGSGSLVHLVDGVVHRRDEILDIAAIERRDEGPPQRGENLARQLVGLGLARRDISWQPSPTSLLPLSRSRTALARGMSSVQVAGFLGRDESEVQEKATNIEITRRGGIS